MERVFSESINPKLGFNALCAIPVFAFADVRSKIAYTGQRGGDEKRVTVPVVSEPVPAVVGIAISGDSDFRIGRPFPRGALTKSRNSASGWFKYKFAILAVSMTEPPPTAINPSTPASLVNLIASVKLSLLTSPGKGLIRIIFRLNPNIIEYFVLNPMFLQRPNSVLHGK